MFWVLSLEGYGNAVCRAHRMQSLCVQWCVCSGSQMASFLGEWILDALCSWVDLRNLFCFEFVSKCVSALKIVSFKKLIRFATLKLSHRLIIYSVRCWLLRGLKWSVWQIRFYWSIDFICVNSWPVQCVWKKPPVLFIYLLFYVGIQVLPKIRKNIRSIYLLKSNHMDAWHAYYIFVCFSKVKFKGHANALSQKEE